jgi:hypothetical protein
MLKHSYAQINSRIGQEIFDIAAHLINVAVIYPPEEGGAEFIIGPSVKVLVIGS